VSEVRAAGGVVSRRRGNGDLEVLVVHRPRYDDWTFPKGKAEADEDDETCALREVREEALLRCSLGRELGRVRYTDARGQPKTVRYWEMLPEEGEAAPGDGVDRVRWVALADAASLLTHDGERGLLAALAN
jgi:8-oxo-dGTP pyrophosphatase MutT (NUDIX family)